MTKPYCKFTLKHLCMITQRNNFNQHLYSDVTMAELVSIRKKMRTEINNWKPGSLSISNINEKSTIKPQ